MGPCSERKLVSVVDVLGGEHRPLAMEAVVGSCTCMWLRGRGVTHLGKVDAKSIHVKTVQEARKALAKPGETFVHKLKVHHVCLEVGHGIGQLGKGWLEYIERKYGIASTCAAGRVSKGRPGGGAERRVRARCSCP